MSTCWFEIQCEYAWEITWGHGETQSFNWILEFRYPWQYLKIPPSNHPCVRDSRDTLKIWRALSSATWGLSLVWETTTHLWLSSKSGRSSKPYPKWALLLIDILIKECTERIRQLVNFDFHPTSFWAFPGAIDEARIPVDESADGQMPGLTAKSVHSWMQTREKWNSDRCSYTTAAMPFVKESFRVNLGGK